MRKNRSFLCLPLTGSGRIVYFFSEEKGPPLRDPINAALPVDADVSMWSFAEASMRSR